MTHRIAAECIDLPFCGKVIVFGGDFRQILVPVVRHGTQADVSSACLNRVPLKVCLGTEIDH